MTSPRPDPGHVHGAGQGPVLVDVGGDHGALVVLTRPELAGLEIEISRHGRARTGAHVAVHSRPAGATSVHAAVFPSLQEGTYELWAAAPEPVLRVDVQGGKVITVPWPAAS